MNPLHTSCKKATYLISKKEESRLSLLEKIRLRGHLTICGVCRRFEEQTDFIGRMARHSSVEVFLSDESKEKMEAALEQLKVNS